MTAQVTAPAGWIELLDATGQTLLQQIKEMQTAGKSPAQQQQALRRECSNTALIAAALRQVELQHKAHKKFGDLAAKLLFTPAGLEQASRAEVAQLHASRMRAFERQQVLDLGCGIGAESLAFVAAGYTVVAYEIDPLTAAYAEHNLKLLHEELGLHTPPPQVICGDATAFCDAQPSQSAVFFDPARRTSGHKNTVRVSPADYSPHLDFVFEIATRFPTLVKLGPGFDRELIPSDAAAEWVSVRGEAVETLLTFTPAAVRKKMRLGGSTTPLLSLTAPGSRHATVLPQQLTLSSARDSEDPSLGELSAYLYEPDAAVIRARQIGQLAAQLEAQLVSPGIAYLSGPRRFDTPFAQVFRVLEVLPVKTPVLAKRLTALGVSSVEIKKRGIAVDPTEFRRKLKLRPAAIPRELTLVLTRIAGQHRAILCERLPAVANVKRRG